MLHDHLFPMPPPRRSASSLVRQFGLPVAVVIVGVAIMAAGMLGVDPRWLWAASVALSGFVMLYTLITLIRSRRRSARISARLDRELAAVRTRCSPAVRSGYSRRAPRRDLR